MSSQGTSLICAVGLGLVTALISEVAAQTGLQDPPALSQRPAAIACSFTGPLVHVPSKSAGTEGLLVRISPPARGRYPQGAPIAVHMIASRPNVAGSLACLSERGFVDVGFLCPGGEYRDAGGALWRSGGAVVNQASAQQCVEPLGDVLSFATGNLRSTEGKSIQDYVPGVRAMTENAGIIGWSFGGNLSVLAMARYSDRFPNLKWYASWETPILGPVDDGRGTFYEPNPFYNPQTDEIDFTRLRYSHNMPVWVWPVIGLGPQPDWPRGGLFLDGDGNGQFSRDVDFAFWVDLELGPPFKVFYSPMVTRRALQQRIFGDAWPAHIATIEELEARARRVDALRQIPQVVRRFPRLAVLVFESHEHHVAGFGGARHVNAVAQVNGWLAARARWVRFSPDIHYLAQVMGKTPARPVQYPAMKAIDLKSIADLLEPEAERGGPTDGQAMSAVVCELADRTQLNIWTPTLSHALVQ
jgi:hypothetical protein